jgi:hypothetical protein
METSSEKKILTGLRMRLRIARIPILRSPIIDSLRTTVLQSFEIAPKQTLSIIVTELSRSTDGNGSILILWLLEQIAIAFPNNNDMQNLFPWLPGRGPLERLAFCIAAIRYSLCPMLTGLHNDLIERQINYVRLDMESWAGHLRSEIK